MVLLQLFVFILLTMATISWIKPKLNQTSSIGFSGNTGIINLSYSFADNGLEAAPIIGALSIKELLVLLLNNHLLVLVGCLNKWWIKILNIPNSFCISGAGKSSLSNKSIVSTTTNSFQSIYSI